MELEKIAVTNQNPQARPKIGRQPRNQGQRKRKPMKDEHPFEKFFTKNETTTTLPSNQPPEQHLTP
tara:strand:- start:2306 stop:2503 length:198 start_codon:yes stop_codon:yes gene_type:complete